VTGTQISIGLLIAFFAFFFGFTLTWVFIDLRDKARLRGQEADAANRAVARYRKDTYRA
jgi:hypothetical protein